MKKVLLLVSAIAITSSAFCSKDACTDQPKKCENMKCEKTIDKTLLIKELKEIKQKFNALSYQEQEKIKATVAKTAVSVVPENPSSYTFNHPGAKFPKEFIISAFAIFVVVGILFGSLPDRGDYKCISIFGFFEQCRRKNFTITK
jgi:hypothetical protein